MSRITTHVLDTSLGRPAAGIPVTLERHASESWVLVASGVTDADGRIPGWVPEGTTLPSGTYRIRFETAGYLLKHADTAFYPRVEVLCTLAPEGHYHLPLLLSPYGYSTYRGS